MAERISSLLRQSISHLADEVPDSYRLLLDTLGPLVVDINVDGEQFSVRGGLRFDVTDRTDDGADTRIATSRSAILNVLDADITLDHAIQTGEVHVQGTLEDVLRAHDALLAYAHAAVRAPSQPKLLSALRLETL
jgi:ubiquinone biosynthesis protein UbiJ